MSEETTEAAPAEDGPAEVLKGLKEQNDRMAELNKESAANNLKHQELMDKEAGEKLEDTFGGKAKAGTGKAKETDVEYKDKVMRGEV